MVLYRHVNVALRVLNHRWKSTHTAHYRLEVLALNVKVTKKALKFLKKSLTSLGVNVVDEILEQY